MSTRYLYGGTYNLFHYTLRRLGIEVRFVDRPTRRTWPTPIDANTRLVYTESIGNPKNNVDDFEAVAGDRARRTASRSSSTTRCRRYIFRPFDHGADIVVYSLTKFIGGHGTSIGGAIVDSGRFDWANGEFPELTEPDPSYHGLVFWDAFGTHERAVAPGAAFIIKARVQLLRDLGAVPVAVQRVPVPAGPRDAAPADARHCANALEVARVAGEASRGGVGQLPGPAGPPDHARARALPHATAPARSSASASRAGSRPARRFIDGVQLFCHLANIGDAKSLVIHPASTTHQQLSRRSSAATGVTDDFVRLSVGIEDVDDIIADLDQAIKAAAAAGGGGLDVAPGRRPGPRRDAARDVCEARPRRSTCGRRLDGGDRAPTRPTAV